MNYGKLIITILSGISFVLSASLPASDRTDENLTDDELNNLAQIIAEEDNPQRIAVLWGNRRRINYWPFQGHFEGMVRLNRIESFKFLYPRLKLTGESGHICSLLMLCVSEKRQEIFHFLIAQNDFSSEEFVFWVRFNMSWCRSAADGMAVLETIRQVIERNPEIAKSQNKLFVLLMKALIYNKQLDDSDMATILSNLFEMGTTVEASIIDEFGRTHPNYPLAQSALSNSQGPEIKEPEGH
jgi:hypothetical protein